ncbi:transcriptional regulator, TetR family [Labilithrix luteola]|uniref:Transcriptional regulator, TetR family n=1 Tax=Labilithrix luteola TaxID=1391654 RepID=A0A0K1Q4P9_9BACT|nr:TetR/AcrR family transcriptional regulator [Labilithrix luteola]AKV00647.1 transcriptional regulator, TetR family [Labilithrix luteola]
MGATKAEGSARDRLLAAANELFYREGVHTVGIERVLEKAGVAKASLYSTFGSKEALVRAYLEARAQRRQARIAERIAQHEEARDKILAIFDLLAEIAAEPGYRGCAFVNATAEEPEGDTQVRQVAASTRTWLLAIFLDLAKQISARDGEVLARQLGVLYDGAVVGASMERDPKVPREARQMAERLLDTFEMPRAASGKTSRTKRSR